MWKSLLPMIAALAAPLAAQSPMFEAARGVATTQGQWSYARTTDGSEARFSNLFVISCSRSTRLVALRRLDVGAGAALTIATDLSTRTLPPSGVLGSADRLLDAIAFSRGRFLVSGGISSAPASGGASAPMLAIPASPEAARSIEDCRN